MNQAESAKVIRMLQAGWRNTEIPDPEETATIYWLGLQKFTYQDVEAAVVACIEDCTFMPTVHELREHLPQVRDIRRLSSPDTDLNYILREFIGNAVALGLYDASSGRIRKPDRFPNPIMAEAVRLFGWGRILDGDREWLPREWEKVWTLARETVTKQFLAGELVLDEAGMLESGDKPIPLWELAARMRKKASGE